MRPAVLDKKINMLGLGLELGVRGLDACCPTHHPIHNYDEMPTRDANLSALDRGKKILGHPKCNFFGEKIESYLHLKTGIT